MAYKLFDYYHNVQAHTKKVIGTFNSASVWDFAGLTRPITVAVIDDGIDAHEDLPSSRILTGFNFAEGETDTRPGRKMTHGMACAGIIAGSHTTDSLGGSHRSSGIISLSPNVKILPVNVFDSLGSFGLVDLQYHISEPIR
jgi:subtilisin family serine protease